MGRSWNLIPPLILTFAISCHCEGASLWQSQIPKTMRLLRRFTPRNDTVTEADKIFGSSYGDES
jgi:hypothetical protein